MSDTPKHDEGCRCWTTLEARAGIGYALIWRREISRPSSGLSASAVLVAHVLTDWMDGEGRCWASYSMIAAHARPSVRTVRRAVEELRDDDWLTWRPGDGRGHANEYTALMPARVKVVMPDDVKATAAANDQQKQANEKGARADKRATHTRAEQKGGQTEPKGGHQERKVVTTAQPRSTTQEAQSSKKHTRADAKIDETDDEIPDIVIRSAVRYLVEHGREFDGVEGFFEGKPDALAEYRERVAQLLKTKGATG